MIKSPAICDADVWIKLVKVNSYKLIFQTFNEINMVGVVIKEIRCFGGYTDPGRFLDFKLSKGKILKRRLRDFPPDKIKAFQYTISQYRLKCQTYETDFNKGSTHSGKNSNLGEIVSAVIAQELKIPILVSDDGFAKILKEDFDLRLYTHDSVLDHCQMIKVINKTEADSIFREIEKLGIPRQPSRSLLQKLKNK